MPSSHYSLPVIGMTCASCVSRVEKALLSVPGVLAAQVNLASEQARITQLPSTDDSAVLAALNKAGYPGKWLDEQRTEDPDEQSTKLRHQRWHLIAAALLSAPLAFGMVPELFGRHDLMVPPMIQLVLASIVQFGFGARFYRGAWHALRNFTGNMDLLVAMGMAVAFAEPDLDPEQRADVLGVLGIDVGNPDLSEVGGEVVRGSVAYRASVIDSIIRLTVTTS